LLISETFSQGTKIFCSQGQRSAIASHAVGGVPYGVAHCFHIQEVWQFLPKGRALSASMESELLARLYDYCLWGHNCWQDCPMGAQMGGELLLVGSHKLCLPLSKRDMNNINCCLWGHKLCL